MMSQRRRITYWRDGIDSEDQLWVCICCGAELNSDCVLDVCPVCGVKIEDDEDVS
ncbi:MAG: hypothetical protein P4L79_09940 [Legionella sp.]|uniref:hypothetical protein n=1 Tax=Legionella sp. TaxID=459 RepID=UPI002848B4F6|nr:hypothetical protein [Legionella sp.]